MASASRPSHNATHARVIRSRAAIWGSDESEWPLSNSGAGSSPGSGAAGRHDRCHRLQLDLRGPVRRLREPRVQQSLCGRPFADPQCGRGSVRGEERNPEPCAHLRRALDPDLGNVEGRPRIRCREQEAQVVVGAQLRLGEAVLLGQPQDAAQRRRRFDEPAEDLEDQRLRVHRLGDLGHHVQPLGRSQRPLGPLERHLRLLVEHVRPGQLSTHRDHRRLAVELGVFLGRRPQRHDGRTDLAAVGVRRTQRSHRSELADSLADGAVALDRARQVPPLRRRRPASKAALPARSRVLGRRRCRG